MLVKSCKHLLGFLLVCTWAMQGHADDDPEKTFTYCTSLPAQEKGYRADILEQLVAPQYQLDVEVLPAGKAPRLLKLIESGFFKCDVVIGGPQVGDYTNMERLPVPIMKGLSGTRLLITTPEKNEHFVGVSSLEDFKNKFVIGTGYRWADLPLLERHGLNLVPAEVRHFASMLAGDRVDAYLRSVAGYIDVLKDKTNTDHIVADNVALAYQLGSYIYLNPKNTEKLSFMKNRVRDFVSSGEFDAFFYAHPDTKAALGVLNLSARKLFVLSIADEFYFPKDAPASYWFWNDDRSE